MAVVGLIDAFPRDWDLFQLLRVFNGKGSFCRNLPQLGFVWEILEVPMYLRLGEGPIFHRYGGPIRPMTARMCPGS